MGVALRGPYLTTDLPKKARWMVSSERMQNRKTFYMSGCSNHKHNEWKNRNPRDRIKCLYTNIMCYLILPKSR